MLLCTALAGAQVNTQNYIRVRKMLNNTETNYIIGYQYKRNPVKFTYWI